MGREYSLKRLKTLHINIIKTMTKQLEENTVHARGLAVRMTALRQAMINLEVCKQLEASKLKPISVQEIDGMLERAKAKAQRLQGRITE